MTPRRGPPGRRQGERGAATVLVVALLGVLVLVGAALGVVGAIFAAHRTAQAAADLAALAGASVVGGAGDPCTVAATTAAANGARLTSCALEDRDLVVTVEVTGPRWRGLVSSELVAQSRAGPG